MDRDFASMSASELSAEFLLWGHTVLFYRRRLSSLEALAAEARGDGRDLTLDHVKGMNRARTRLRLAERAVTKIEEQQAKRSKAAA